MNVMAFLRGQPLGDLATAVALKGAAILVLALLATRLLRKQSAAVRHGVWLVALLAQLGTPLLGAVLPTWWPALPSWTLTVGLKRDAVPNATTTALTNPAPAGAADAPSISADISRPSLSSTPSTIVVPNAVSAKPLDWKLVALTVWGSGAALVLLWLFAGSFGVALIARRAERVTDGDWLALATQVSKDMGLNRPVVLLRGHGLAVPVTWGILVPVVLLPIDADDWMLERRRTVLLHELAHVRRFDMLSQLVAHLVLALCWFDPLVWLGVRSLRSESEKACDDCVLQHGTEPSAYVNDLLAIVRSARPTRVPALAALAMARPTEFEGRVLAILDASTQRRNVGRVAKLATIVAAFVVVAPLAAMRPADARAASQPTADGTKHDTTSIAAHLPMPSPEPPPPSEPAPSAPEQTPPTSMRTSAVTSSITSSITSTNTNVSMNAPNGTVQPRPAPTPTPTPSPTPSIEPFRYNLRGDANVKVKQPNVRVRYQPARPAASSAAVAPLISALSDTDADVRNSAVHALGEIEDPRAVEALMQALRRDTDARVRETAAWALGQIEDPKAVPALTEALRSDQVPAVRKQAAWALGQIEDKGSVDALGAALRDSNAEVRRTAMWALGQIEDPRSVPFLVPALRNDDADVRKTAAWALGQIESKDAVEPLAAALKDASIDVRETVAWALGQIEDARAVPPLVAALKDATAGVRNKAAWALGQIESKDAVPGLVAALEDSDRDVRKTAAWALGQIEDPAAVNGLAAMARSSDVELRRASVHALSQIGGATAVDALVALLKDPDPEVRRAAVQALGRR